MKRRRIISFLLALCICFSVMPITAQAASSYNAGNAVAYAASHWNDGVGLCAEFVSNCLRAGGLSSWNRECTNLYNQLNNEVVGGARIASVQYLTTSGNYIRTSDNVGKISKGDVLFWLCSGCPTDSVGGPYQHTALISDVSGTYVKVYQHNGAVNNQPAWVGNCYECGRRYSHMVVIHFGSSPTPTTVKEYFSCNVEIRTTKGKTVNLFNKPTDTSRKTYFDQGQTAYSTRGAKLSDGSTWYEIQAIDNGKTVTLWLNAKSSGITVRNLSVPLSISFSPSSITMNSGESKTVSIDYKGDNVYLPAFIINDDSICSATWGDVDVNTGKAALIVTGKTAGSTSIKINLIDSNRKILYTKSFTVSVNSNRVSVSANPSSLSLNLASNSSGTVRLNINGSYGGAGGTGDSDGVVRAEWLDYGSGYAVAKFTAVKVGTDNFTFQVYDETKTKVVASTTVRITVTAPTYTVSYNANGGSGAPSSQAKQYDKTLTLSSIKPTRAGYTFKGWATSSAASSVQYQPGSSYSSNKDLTLYAVWERNKVESSLTFSTSSLSLNPGSSETISVNFKGEGIKYLGFSPENKNNSICYLSWADIDWKNGTTKVTVTGKEPGTEAIKVHFMDKDENSFFSKNFTVTVKSPSYTVSYHDNGGSGAPSSQMKQYGKPLVLSSAEPARNGYVFIGWAESPGASSAQFEPGDTFTGNKDLSLYAVWQIAHQHSLTHISEKPATETSEGNIEHWYCNGCGKYFSDAKAVNEISQSQTVLTKLKHIHSLTAYPEVASTCTKGGNLAYWRCGECGKYYSDVAGNNETSDTLVSLQPLGHNYVNGVCTRDGAVDPKHSGQTNEVHLPKQNSYSQGHFSDVYPNQWFTDNVASAYELGLIKGKSSRIFDPYGDVTLAETITMACRIHSIYTKGYEDIPQGDGGKWYQQYLDYAYQNNIISWTVYHNANVEGNATRVQFAEIMAKSLPDEGFYAMNSVRDNAIPDVSATDASASYVYKLYRAGILSGGDVRGTFSPQSYITRAEAAAIVSRVAESNNRVSFSLL